MGTQNIANGAVTTTQILDGTIAVADLSTATVNTWLQLASAASKKIAFGSTTLTWSVGNQTSATATVTHGLGTTPTAVLFSANGTGGPDIAITQVTVVGATTFQVFGKFLAGTAAGTVNLTCGWAAIG